MRRALNAQPLNNFDPKIERTFRRRLREKRAIQAMGDQDQDAQALHRAYVADLEAQIAVANNRLALLEQNQAVLPQTLAEYMRPAQHVPISGVVYPEVQARYFELKLSLINMVQ